MVAPSVAQAKVVFPLAVVTVGAAQTALEAQAAATPLHLGAKTKAS